MNALEREIGAMIAEDGPISLERYMALALSHPRYGYYMSRMPIGAEGDFVTAPEISQMFGELIGLWAAEVWTAMGQPSVVRLVELGPGRGTLMADALRAARHVPAFHQALDVHLVETSPLLAERQRQTLASSGATICWHDSIEDVPPGPALIIANEFFDALPVRHYVHDGRSWCERLVGLDAENHLVFGMAKAPEPGITAIGAAGSILEVGVAAQLYMTRLAQRLTEQGGALLAIDYGHVRSAPGETLQAVRQHAFADPLHDPGEADLTTHVDFAALARAARGTGAAVHGPVTQGDWLTRLGIVARAAALKRRANASQSAAIDAALARLAGTAPPTRRGAGMATLFKVLAVTQPGLPQPPGFQQGSTA